MLVRLLPGKRRDCREVETLHGWDDGVADGPPLVLLAEEVGDDAGDALRQAHLLHLLVLDVAAQRQADEELVEIDRRVALLAAVATLARDVTVLPVPAVTGSTAQPVHLNLAAIEVKAAFVTCQRGDGGDEGNATIDFDEFLVCLALCGHIKYEEVEQMSLAQRVEGIVANYLGERDEQAVIDAAMLGPVARFDPAKGGALAGQARAPLARCDP